MPTNRRAFSRKLAHEYERNSNAGCRSLRNSRGPRSVRVKNASQTTVVGTVMSLDISTLYLVAALVGVLLGGMLLFFGRQQKILALNWWGAAYILGAISIGVLTVAGPLLGDGPARVSSRLTRF